jgi:hypothetical protein
VDRWIEAEQQGTKENWHHLYTKQSGPNNKKNKKQIWLFSSYLFICFVALAFVGYPHRKFRGYSNNKQ